MPSPSPSEIPFAVYGLAGGFTGPRRLAAIERDGEAIALVALAHGDGWTARRPGPGSP